MSCSERQFMFSLVVIVVLLGLTAFDGLTFIGRVTPAQTPLVKAADLDVGESRNGAASRWLTDDYQAARSM